MAASPSSSQPTTTTCSLLLTLLSFFLLLHYPPTNAQQNYTGNAIFNCKVNSTRGYSCNASSQPTCNSFLLFRSQSNYQSPVDIAYLLNASAPDISRLNSVPDIDTLPLRTRVLVPVTCSCTPTPSGGPHYQHDAYYTLKSDWETWLMVANDTYHGLSTCKAMIVQNRGHRPLRAGVRLKVPLRCACPTRGQVAAGYKYLLTYAVTWRDSLSAIAARYNTSVRAVLDANQLRDGANIYPFTTLLVPLRDEPTEALLASPAPRPQPAPSPTSGPVKSSGVKWVGVGVGVGLVLLAVILLVAFWLLHRRRRRSSPRQHYDLGGSKARRDPSSAKYGGRVPCKSTLSDEVRALVGALAAYKFEELERATGSFGEEHRIEGSSVYRAVINGEMAAVKRMKGDVTTEISILKQMSHFNLVRLSGFCVHEADTYLVFEYAENGSLRNWLHRGPSKANDSLSWKQRVQVALDVAEGLNYLHNYTTPPCIHKDLSSSNVLLDGEFRAKLSNFGLARSVVDHDVGEMPMQTRHVRGTQGYMSPEYLEHGLVSPKLDVFAFGVVMLELLSGKEPVIVPKGGEAGATLLSAAIEPLLEGQEVRRRMRQFVDPCLGADDYPLDSAFAMAQLANRCVSQDPGARPTITEVFVSLTAIHSAALDWDASWTCMSGESIIDGR